jgi:acyl carrier protein
MGAFETMEAVVTNISDIKELETKIAAIIIEELKLEDVTPETFDVGLDLIDELGVDSMDLATIALVLQDEFDVTVDEEDYPNLKSVSLIAQHIQEKVAAKSA